MSRPQEAVARDRRPQPRSPPVVGPLGPMAQAHPGDCEHRNSVHGEICSERPPQFSPRRASGGGSAAIRRGAPHQPVGLGSDPQPHHPRLLIGKRRLDLRRLHRAPAPNRSGPRPAVVMGWSARGSRSAAPALWRVLRTGARSASKGIVTEVSLLPHNMDVYSHVLPDLRRDAAARLDQLFGRRASP